MNTVEKITKLVCKQKLDEEIPKDHINHNKEFYNSIAGLNKFTPLINFNYIKGDYI